MLVHRNILSEIEDALTASPVVLLNGARQTGKSTLAQGIASRHDFDYVTLDDFTALDAATRDPVGYLSLFHKQLIIDEIQRAPQLFLAIKQLVDKDRQPGRFLLTGSANVFMLPKLSESLAGRMEIITLWPFSCHELLGRKGTFIDELFSNRTPTIPDDNLSRESLIDNMIRGGYPEIQKLASERRRNAWLNAYITTILQRDIKDISRIEGVQQLPRLLSLVATQSGSLVNMSSLSRDAGLVMMTLKRYLALLEATFLIKRLPAWFRNIGKRLLKSPKIYLIDTGLFSYLIGLDRSRLNTDPKLMGQLLESFVMQELFKQSAWSNTLPEIYYYRSTAGREVDFVLESRAGRIVGVEVKASATVTAVDFKGLEEIRGLLGKQFIKGIVLYTGQSTVSFGKNLFAVPVSALWSS
jgi:predicted AAA+ superfamily ATPase